VSPEEVTVRDLLDAEVGALHTKIDALGTQVAQGQEALGERLTANQMTHSIEIAEVRADVAEVNKLATATNGNVRKLQLWRAKLEGARWAVGSVPVIIACIAGLSSIASLAVTVVLALTHH
jgi:hypothetical protein